MKFGAMKLDAIKKATVILPGLIILAANGAFAAQGMDNRACNLQGREVALRISEEVGGDIDASARTRMAEIAEAVCMDYLGMPGNAGNAGNVGNAANHTAGMPVVSRPAAENTANGEAEAEADGGLLGNLRVIDSEDRVKRPGLKRR